MIPWTWKIKKLYINGTIGFCNINFYGMWNSFVYKVFKFVDNIRKDLTFKFYYPDINKVMVKPEIKGIPSFRIEDCLYKEDFEEIKNRILVYKNTIKKHTDIKTIQILEANINMLFEHLKTLMMVFAKRELVLTWWRTFTLDEQRELVKKYFEDFNFLMMNSIKIEEIYDAERV